ncbi:serum paraoxonase arylesterase [Paraphaeosphaeria sporulosa]
MKHLRTVWDPETMYTPNNVAAVGNGAFVVTNDHSKSFGLRKSFDNYIGGGGVTYCSPTSTCFPITPPRTFRMPNGLARGADGLIYVPSTITGTISVFSLASSAESASIPPAFTLVDTIHVGMPLDNLALDASGDLWIPGFPNGAQVMKWTEDPVGNKSPATVWRIKKVEGVYELEKVLEDREAAVLNGITTVRHDAKTGRLFMGAVFNEFVVCDPIA